MNCCCCCFSFSLIHSFIEATKWHQQLCRLQFTLIAKETTTYYIYKTPAAVSSDSQLNLNEWHSRCYYINFAQNDAFSRNTHTNEYVHDKMKCMLIVDDDDDVWVRVVIIKWQIFVHYIEMVSVVNCFLFYFLLCKQALQYLVQICLHLWLLLLFCSCLCYRIIFACSLRSISMMSNL